MASVLETGRAWVDRVRAVIAGQVASRLHGQRIVQLFREAGALTPDTVQPFRPRSRIEERAFLHLLRLGVIREPARGRYYLDEEELRASVPLQGVLPWW